METNNKSNNFGDWISEKETRELTSLKGTTLWRLRKNNEIKFSKIANRVFYSKTSIIDFLNKNSN